MSCILATDMGRHADDLKNLNAVLEKYEITEGANVENLVQDRDEIQVN